MTVNEFHKHRSGVKILIKKSIIFFMGTVFFEILHVYNCYIFLKLYLLKH